MISFFFLSEEEVNLQPLDKDSELKYIYPFHTQTKYFPLTLQIELEQSILFIAHYLDAQ